MGSLAILDGPSGRELKRLIKSDIYSLERAFPRGALETEVEVVVERVRGTETDISLGRYFEMQRTAARVRKLYLGDLP